MLGPDFGSRPSSKPRPLRMPPSGCCLVRQRILFGGTQYDSHCVTQHSPGWRSLCAATLRARGRNKGGGNYDRRGRQPGLKLYLMCAASGELARSKTALRYPETHRSPLSQASANVVTWLWYPCSRLCDLEPYQLAPALVDQFQGSSKQTKRPSRLLEPMVTRNTYGWPGPAGTRASCADCSSKKPPHCQIVASGLARLR